MSTLSIRRALEIELSGIAPTLDTAWENDNFTPVTGTPYQAAYLLLGEPNNIEFGRVFRQVGVFQINLYYPLKTGVFAATTRAELIRSTFVRGNSYTNGDVTVTINKTPNIKPSARFEDRLIIPIDIEFFSHITT